MVICLELGADLHMAQRMPQPLTVSCFSKIQIGFTFLVLAYPASPGKRAVKRVFVCILRLLSRRTCFLFFVLYFITSAIKWQDALLIHMASLQAIPCNILYVYFCKQPVSTYD